MAEEFATWTTLACDCGGQRFVRVFSLATRVNGGTVDTPQGWECTACRNMVDLGAMAQGALLRQLEAEIAERKAQIAARTPLKPSSATPAP
jgi:hypothetical protein